MTMPDALPYVVVGLFPAVLVTVLAYLFFTDDEPVLKDTPAYPFAGLEALAEADPFAELDEVWCEGIGVDWVGSGVPSLRWRAEGLPSRPATHARRRRGF